MPVSKARTAYGLLSEIQALILEEPKRYDQDNWIAEPGEVAPPYAPKCGTVACVGGWVYTLKPPSDKSVDGHIHAATVLGITYEESWELFSFTAAGDRGETPRSFRAHAKRGAAHIARFQKKYAKQLKAKRV